MKRLNKVLDSISPKNTYVATRSAAERALNEVLHTFKCVKTHEDVMHCCGVTYYKVDCRIIGSERPYSEFMDVGRSKDVLVKLYGPRGVQIATERGISGQNGGIRKVAEGIALYLAEEYAANWVSCAIIKHYEGVSQEEKSKDAREYLDMYGHLLPEEIVSRGAFWIGGILKDVLEKHPQVMMGVQWKK